MSLLGCLEVSCYNISVIDFSDKQLFNTSSTVHVMNSSGLFKTFEHGFRFCIIWLVSQAGADGEGVVGPEEGLALLQRVRKLLLVRLRQHHRCQPHLKVKTRVRQMVVERAGDATAKVMLPKTKMGRTG